MRHRVGLALALLTSVLLALTPPAAAQEKPRLGGELIFEVAAEPPSFDAHQEETFAMLHPGAPQYNTLMRVDPFDRTGTKFIGDLAESWTISPDRRTYTFKVRHGVKFHDGSLMTSKDVKASYDHIIFPPPSVVSSRVSTYQAVESVEAPTPDTIVFRLKHPEASFMANLAQPWNWIYKADILAKDPNWYKTNVMGTGPFKFVEYVRGAHWVGKKNPDYWDKGKPYLDSFRAIFIPSASAQVAAIRGERAMIQFRSFTPADRDSLVNALGSFAIAKARQQAQVGVLADAFGDETFVRALVAAVGEGLQLKSARGNLQFKPTSAFAQLVGADFGALPVTLPSAQSSNTIVTLSDKVFVKAYRRLQAGTNPEAEVGRYLTDVARFPHIVPVAGSVEYVSEDGRTATLALIQQYVQNQGSGWEYTLNYLDRFFEDTTRESATPAATDVHGGYAALARTLGRRTAELHAALARKTGDAAFDPLPIAATDIAAWTERARAKATAVLDRLMQRRDALPESVRGDAESLLAQRDQLLARIGAHANDGGEGSKTRIHGDYHLGQVLVAQNDFVIIDFEGEPDRTMEERAHKHSPLRDVAGMLRSFDYALHAALFKFVSGRPDAREAVEAAGRQWQAQAEGAFLDGYDEVARTRALASARGEMDRLLELFVLEKALYELSYEVDHRPDWVRIPLVGLLDVMKRAAEPAPAKGSAGESRV